MAASLLHGLKLDFGLNRSRLNLFSSFLKCYFNRNILPSASNSILSFALSIILEVGIKLSSFDNKVISESVRFRLDKFTTFLLAKLPCNLLSNIFAALSFTFNLLSIELAFTSRISTELSFLRSFFPLHHLWIHLNVGDNSSFQNQEENFHEN